MERKLVIFTDIGDTVIDEGTEIRDVPCGVVKKASCIAGAKETMLKLYEDGYPIVMVADGLVQSFHNTMEQNGLDHIFSAWVISEPLRVEKPHELMFRTAMDALHLTDADKGRVIMIGNNTKRDILGANRFGIRSVLLQWSDRHPSEPECKDEEPTYLIHKPEELLPLVERLNNEL